MRYVLGLLCILVPLLAEAQSATVTLLWDYVDQGQTGFVLTRKTGQAGTYADLPLPISAAARTVTDATVVVGQIYCYRLYATSQAVKGSPSNETCWTMLTGPLNLRIQ